MASQYDLSAQEIQEATGWPDYMVSDYLDIHRRLDESTIEYVKLSDVKAANTAGGTFTAGSWQTRTLNTSEGGSYCTLNSNQFTLPRGEYRIFARTPALTVDRHKAKLRNITDSADTIIGTSEFSDNAIGGHGVTHSVINGSFTILDTTTFEIQHMCQVTALTNGFGVASNFSVDEVYTIVEIWKIG